MDAVNKCGSVVINSNVSKGLRAIARCFRRGPSGHGLALTSVIIVSNRLHVNVG